MLSSGEHPEHGSVEKILDGLSSIQSAPERRIDLLQQLERQFGHAVLDTKDDRDDKDERSSLNWWSAQSRPRSCVSLALLSLVHRLHLVARLSSIDEDYDPSHEMTTSFTILQGLCLKEQESRTICSKQSTLELTLAIIDAPYWRTLQTDGQAIAHAVDFLICVTMASRAALTLFDTLKGEDVVRTLMERYAPLTSEEASTSTQTRRTVRLDEVQDSPIALKCAEFLLLLASERNESSVQARAVLGDQTSILGDGSIVQQWIVQRRAAKLRMSPRVIETHVSAHTSASTRKRSSESVIQRSRRARSMSPVKASHSKRGQSSIGRTDSLNELRTAEGGEALTARLRRSDPPTRSVTLGMHTKNQITEMQSGLTGNSPAKRRSAQSSRNASPSKVAFVDDMPFVRGSAHGTTTKSRPLSMLRNNHLTTPMRSSDGAGLMDSRSNKSDLRDHQAAYCVGSSGPTLLPNALPREDSPTKAFIGPSPAVRRAHERSRSPDKGRLPARTG